MTDLEKGKCLLEGHSLVLVKGDSIIVKDGKGIIPLFSLIDKGVNLEGYSLADLVIGKAAATLIVKAKIMSVYGQTISQDGLDYLKKHGVGISYGELVPLILNQTRTASCPMEAAVKDIEDYEEAFLALKAKLAS